MLDREEEFNLVKEGNAIKILHLEREFALSPQGDNEKRKTVSYSRGSSFLSLLPRSRSSLCDQGRKKSV